MNVHVKSNDVQLFDLLTTSHFDFLQISKSNNYTTNKASEFIARTYLKLSLYYRIATHIN